MIKINPLKSIRYFIIACLIGLSPVSVSSDANQKSVTKSDASYPADAPVSFPLDEQQIRQTMQQALEAFNTPSAAVNIIYKGKSLFAGALGNRQLAIKKQSNSVNHEANQHTYYRLASVSKAFTAAAMAVLVDQGKVAWDDKVTDHLPAFQMQDPWVTREFTIKDLLTHRSGLVSAAGDMMIWPEPSGFTRLEVVHNLRYLTPKFSFRNQYAYSNVLYITAGELIAKVSGVPFDTFVDEYVFKPLDMKCFAGDIAQDAMLNTAMSYGFDDKQGVYAIERNSIHGNALMSSAAGGMVCNAHEMGKWIHALLSKKGLPFSTSSLDEMWQPQTILNVSEIDEAWDGTLFKSYGLGWRLSNLYEHKMISHTGTLSGYQAYIALIPDFELGVVVLNNGSNYGVRGAIMQTIIKAALAAHKGQQYADDWVQNYVDYQAEREAAYLARNIKDPKSKRKTLLKPKHIQGVYKDKWYGEFKVDVINKKTIRFSHNKMTTLQGQLFPFQDNTYKVEWDDSNAQSPAFVIFDVDANDQVTGFKMYPFTKTKLTRHDYLDMYFEALSL